MRLAILTMVLGAFAIGLTEFAVTGLLPQIAADLAVSIPAAGNLVTAYAIGVVVGAPLLTAVGARLSQRTLLLVFMGLFALGNGLAAAHPLVNTALVEVHGDFETGWTCVAWTDGPVGGANLVDRFAQDPTGERLLAG